MFLSLDLSGAIDVSAQLSVYWPGEDDPYMVDAGGLSIARAIELYCDFRRSSEGTRASYRTTARRFESWRCAHRCLRPMRATELVAEDIRDFLQWCHAEAVGAGDGNPANTFNKRRRELLAVLTWLASYDAPPRHRLESLPAFPSPMASNTVAGLYYLTDAEYSACYWATSKMRKYRGWSMPLPIGDYFRAALVISRRHPMDTGLLMPYLRKHHTLALRWRNFSSGLYPPGRVAKVTSQHGHLTWRRQKTRRKPAFIRPVDEVTAAHLAAIRPPNASPDDWIFGTPKPGGAASLVGGSRPNDRLRDLFELAGIEPKTNEHGEAADDWCFKDLRKNCATNWESHSPELTTQIMGHASRDITHEHYANSLPAIYEAMQRFPALPCERSILEGGTL